MPSKKTSQENIAKARAKMAEIVKRGKQAQKKVVYKEPVEEPESEYSSEEDSQYEYEYVDQSEDESESEEEVKPKKVRGGKTRLTEEEKMAVIQAREEAKRLKKEAQEVLKQKKRQAKLDAMSERFKSLMSEQLSAFKEEFKKDLKLSALDKDRTDALKRTVLKL